MDSFVYIAHDLKGMERRGLRRGVSQYEVYTWLHKHGLIPIEVKPASSTAVRVESRSRAVGNKRPKNSELSAFAWQLSTMVEGGVLITEAMDTIAADTENVAFGRTLVEISDRMKKGESFAMSIADYPRVFDKLYCAMMRAGESSGALPTVLTRLAEYSENRDKFGKKIKAALAYPIFVLSFIFLILVIMMTVVIPKFRLIFDQMGGELPAFTQGFLGIYDFTAHNIVYVTLFFVSLSMMATAYYKTERGHMRLGALALAMPLIGKVKIQAFIATFCKTMSTLLSAGVSIIEAFDILSEMSDNDLMKSAVINSKEQIMEGSRISEGLASSELFPAMVSRMVEVGEKSGSLADVLDKASRYYESKMDSTIATLLSLLGPIVIVFVGAIVMVVVIALYLPVFSMSAVPGG